MNTQHGDVDAAAGLGRVTTFEALHEIPAGARVITIEDLPEIPSGALVDGGRNDASDAPSHT